MSSKILSSALAALICAFTVPAYSDTVVVTDGDEGVAIIVCEFNSQTNTLTFTVTNDSSGGEIIAAIGFDLPPVGNGSASGLNGFAGSQAPSLSSRFTFSDADLGKVPGFKDAVLDFGFITGKDFKGKDRASALQPGASASFVVSGAAFAGLTEEQICRSIFVAFK